MEEIAIAAAVQGGYLFRHQLLDLGQSDQAIRRLVQRGQLIRLRHGTCAPTASFALLTDTEKHRVVTFSVLDKLGPNVVATHHSASAIHGHDLWDIDLTQIHVTRLDGRTGRKEAGVVYHEGVILPEADVVEIDGRLVSTSMRSVFEACSRASTESGMVLVSSALRSAHFGKDELVQNGGQFSHWPGTRKARLAISLADGRLETVGEARSLHMMWRQRVPHPELQWVLHSIDGVEIARTDFAWIAARHTGEFDGLIKYGRLNPDPENPGQVIVKEKIREDLVRDQSLGMSRWVWAGLAPKKQAGTARKILEGIERSKKLYLRNGTHISVS